MKALRSIDELHTTASGIDQPAAVTRFEGALWFGTESGDLIRVDPQAGSTDIAGQSGGFLLGHASTATAAASHVTWAEAKFVRIVAGGATEVIADSVAGRKLNSPNFPVFSADDSLWITEFGSFWDTDDGYLFQIGTNGHAEIVPDDCNRFPNGLALSNDGDVLYVVESRLSGVVLYSVNDGVLGEHHLRISPRDGPDGLAFGSAGALYVSCWRPDRVCRLEPDGTPTILLDDPPASTRPPRPILCFGGSNCKHLYFASLGGWALKELEMNVAGQPLAPATEGR